ncbi:MAG: peptidylprolyl isomerase [Alteromonadaceae bacterium]|uniref:peptidylprolyl isomerase n=1 Tax=unclassified Marinobacter TaxID=83889 RepID=UPI000C3C8534|nr:peptidylprolyl isomerase [Marinobacter sp. BGYM27]MAA63577.1 peptidylprolyl isomerase [Alteromonadaceae bacterium]MBH86423.1 peptidylprolyl isomerase [Alteromonadaceae bacterium]MDG5500602.1 peptidylprolyl isomerase [Marinobacter sp. BGYM27]|tara:strand:- start:685 stop:1194 length:510 start_codon:yes stop_codon:yes gene_type:complete
MILLKTNHGDIKIELDYDKAPKSAANFEQYVKDGFYDGLIFHRVIGNFMIQGGGFEPGMIPRKTGEPIRNEANNGLSNMIGTVAMARTMDPHSATAQFFINVENNGFLDHTAETPEGWGYTVFGKTVDSMDTINSIRGVRTTMIQGHQDVPAEEVIIESAEIIEDGGAA